MLRKCFGARLGLSDAAELEAANAKAEYIVKVRRAAVVLLLTLQELEALCALRIGLT